MKKRNMFLTKVIALVVLCSGGACTSIDKSSVRARAGAPDSAVVSAVHLAYDASSPRYVIAVQPVMLSEKIWKTQSNLSGTSTKPPNEEKRDFEYNRDTEYKKFAPRANQISAQLTSALSQVENFKVMTPEALKESGHGTFTINLKKGEVGPFIFKALITEYEARVEEDSRKANILVYDKGEKNVQGVVGLDVQIINGKDGSIVSSFPVYGTFSSKKKYAGSGILPFYRQDSFAQSVTDQALRVALNQVAAKGLDYLKAGAANQ